MTIITVKDIFCSVWACRVEKNSAFYRDWVLCYPVATGAYLLSNGKQVKVLAVNHPSVGYSWDYWYRVLKRFLKVGDVVLVQW